MAKSKRAKIAVIDAETDPFLYGREPKPFAWGFFDGETYIDFWGDKSTERLMDYLAGREDELLIYAHNGGKFDFFLILDHLENPVRIINSRIVSAKLGIHELRDSYAILPIPLLAWNKESIDYRLMERDKREQHRKEILHYLAVDCESLYSIVSKFVDRFGTRLTVGSTAIKELEKFHTIIRTNENHDRAFRPYYYGGRVEALRKGKVTGDFKVYDVNSMYPHVMRNFDHPIGRAYYHVHRPELDEMGNIKGFPDKPYFLRFEGRSNGALPRRTPDGLRFDSHTGEYCACSHEIRASLELGILTITHTYEVWVPKETQRYERFVDHFMVEKIEGKREKNKAKELFAKFMLNSAYGKYGSNPENYFDYLLVRAGEPYPAGDEWDMVEFRETGSIWKKKTPKPFYFDVAIAASITSASRATLLRGLHSSRGAVYMDTDSLICESLNAELSETELGAWKLEATGDTIYIGGKKLYALFDGKDCVKLASKGARLSGMDIARIASGETVKWRNDAPSFKWDGTAKFVDRTIKMT